jgi:Ca2+-binding EF-hand superfamily protein
MLLALGVQPTDEALDEMMASVDTADGINNAGDGKIDMREFLMWYAKGLKANRNVDKEDATDAFRLLSREMNGAAALSPTGAVRSIHLEDKVRAAGSNQALRNGARSTPGALVGEQGAAARLPRRSLRPRVHGG